MASPNTLALRATQANLRPRPIWLDVPRQPKTMLRGEYAQLLRESSRIANRRRRDQRDAFVRSNDAARSIMRAIPTGGPGRRRAKAFRNLRAVVAEMRVAEPEVR